MGTEEREFAMAVPGLYVLRFRPMEGVKKTAKTVVQ